LFARVHCTHLASFDCRAASFPQHDGLFAEAP